MKTIFAVILAFTGALQALPQPVPQAAAPLKDLNTLIDGVDKTFATMKDFQSRFMQISTNSVNQTQQDEGLLYLTRDKKMRVEYGKPGKPLDQLWVSNGKTLYAYVPANRQVTKGSVKDSMAEQFPFMFLLGRSGLRQEFKEIRELTLADHKPIVEGDRTLRLSPNRKTQDIERIEIEVNPRTNLIDRMTILNTDKTSTDFAFFEIETNRNLPASTFEFTPPQGVRVIEGSGIQ
ncbi:MAG TPA: outer membrane lipoprotein chaperone LolA [Terriglobia bacterium]|nr:outer membrane lipoprotein chaperone LolA [Terriglobia bacterium]